MVYRYPRHNPTNMNLRWGRARRSRFCNSLLRPNTHFGLRASLLTLRKARGLETSQQYSMAPFMYRCPNRGFRVQGWAPDDDESERAGDVFVGVTRLAEGCISLMWRPASWPAKAANRNPDLCRS
jgi:hypothetical protein